MITDDQIAALAMDSAHAGDHAQVLICQIALGDVVLDEDTTIASLQVSRFIAPRDQRRIGEKFGTADAARAECERVIDSSSADDAYGAFR